MSSTCAFFVPEVPGGDFALVRAVEGGFELCFQDFWQGIASCAGQRRSLAAWGEGARDIPGWGARAQRLEPGTRVELRWEGIDVVVEEGAGVRPLAGKRRPPAFVLACVCWAAFAIALVAGLPPPRNAQHHARAFARESDAPRVVIVVEEEARRHLTEPTVWRDRPLPPRAQRSPVVAPSPAIDLPALAEAERQAAIARARHGALGTVFRETFDAEFFVGAADSIGPVSEEALEGYGDHHSADLDRQTGAWGYGVRPMGPASGKGDWGTIRSKGYALSREASRGDGYEAQAERLLLQPRRAQAPGETLASQRDGVGVDELLGRLGMLRPSLRRCFVDADLDTPAALQLDMRIDDEGAIEELGIASIDEDGALRCIRKLLNRVRFRGVSPDGARVAAFRLRL